MDYDDAFFRQVVDELPDLVCRFLPDGTLLYVNKAYAAYFGSSPSALTGTNFLDLVPAEERVNAEEALHQTALLTPDNSTRITVHRGGDHEGEVRWQEWVDKALFDDNGALVDLLAVGRDVTDRHHAQERLQQLSERDPLTDLLNRRATLAALDKAIADVSPCSASPLGVVYVDVDSFKRLNDRFGHRHGDRVLVTVSHLLRAAFRHTDMVGRVGGDEFVVICPNLRDLAELGAIANRFDDTLASLQPPLSASYGTVVLRPGESADSLLHRADMAMYQHKNARSPTTA